MTTFNSIFGLAAYTVQFANIIQNVNLTSTLPTNPWSYIGIVEDELLYPVGNNINVTFVSHDLQTLGSYTTTYRISGFYGEDITPYDTFVANNSKSNTEFVYNSYGSLLAGQNVDWDQLVIYKPDNRREVMLRHIFYNSANLIYQNVLQTVHLVPNRHFARLSGIVNTINSNRILVDVNGNQTSPTYKSSILYINVDDYLDPITDNITRT
jgi:hypothetical protein